ncbi:MAG TPA: biotin--[acetyl-CoA-carboxylase] ligase [Halomicronema sp.]
MAEKCFSLGNQTWLHYLESCQSTNSWAMQQGQNLADGDVVFTRNQTAGRGQHGRSWMSPAGVLTASFVLDDLAVSQLAGLSLSSGLAVVYAVEELLPNLQEKLRLKWPNDVWLNERKLAGILCEASTSFSRSRAIVGIGLNCCVDLSALGLDSAISLHEVCGDVPTDLMLLERLRYYLLQAKSILCKSDGGLAALLPELRGRDVLLNREVVLDLGGEEWRGKGAGLDGEGRFLLCLEDNTIKAFSSGRVMNFI